MSVSGPRLKLERAQQHRASLARFLDEAYRVRGEPDRKGPKKHPRPYRWVLHLHEPERAGPIIGDCIYCLRSSLDHLVRMLGERTGVCVQDDDFRQTEFPIFESPGAFRNARVDGHSKMRCVCPLARRGIEALQPYIRRPNAPKTDPLWILQELGNRDKHNMLLTTARVLIDSQLVLSETKNIRLVELWQAPLGPVKDGDLLARLQLAPIDVRQPIKTLAYPNYPAQVVFEQTVPLVQGRKVLDVLDELIADVQSIITGLETMCP